MSDIRYFVDFSTKYIAYPTICNMSKYNYLYMSVNNRIRIISDEFFNGNISAMARAIAIKQPTLRDVISEKVKPSYDTIRQIVDCSSLNIDSEWLLTGRGEMVKTGTEPSLQVIHHPKTPDKIVESQEVTLYDVDAAANLQSLFVNKDQHILGKIRIPNLPKCDGAVYVRGDSMYPLLKSGDIVIYKELHDFNNVIFGEMYLVSMDIEGDEYLAVKYVNRSEVEGCIKLVSYNPHHAPKDVELKYILAMALVKVSIRMNTMK